MHTWVALLYSVTVADGRRLAMGDLRALALSLGFERPETLLSTGNLIFDAVAPDAGAVERGLEPAYEATFGRPVPIVVRAAAAWPALVAANPFPEAAAAEPSRLAVRVLRTPAAAAVAESLESYRAAGERLAVAGGDLWLFLPHGIARSRLAAAAGSGRGGGVGTFRNWNTVRRIDAALAARRAAAP